jgi:hypothetical protein
MLAMSMLSSVASPSGFPALWELNSGEPDVGGLGEGTFVLGGGRALKSEGDGVGLLEDT